MPRDEDKSTIDVYLTGERDPQDPDGLLTIDDAENPPNPAVYGKPKTDTPAAE